MSIARSIVLLACAVLVACSRPKESAPTSPSAAPSATLGRNAQRLLGTWVRNVDELLASDDFEEWLQTAPDPKKARAQVIDEAAHTRMTFRADGTVSHDYPPPQPSATAHWTAQEEGGDDLTIVIEGKEIVPLRFVSDDRMTTDDGKVWTRIDGK